jgi:hypothetical protein
LADRLLSDKLKLTHIFWGKNGEDGEHGTRADGKKEKVLPSEKILKVVFFI